MSPIRILASESESWQRGFFPLEEDESGPFRWTTLQFGLSPPEGVRFVELELGRPDAQAKLAVCGSPELSLSTNLAQGWQRVSVDLGVVPLAAVDCQISPPVAAPGDTRALGVMIRSALFHNDAARHREVEAVRANEILNDAEYNAGAVVLTSTPPNLRISMEVRCNIADENPCVYCMWNWAKQEEAGGPAYDLAFLQQFGAFLSQAKRVNDCSVGEPPLNREFPEVVDLLTSQDRALTMTSNGQTLGRRVRKALLGKTIDLCVSLDSASAEGYARYRDRRFDQIIGNLRQLCEEKRAHDNLPRVSLSFIVMHSNKTEIADFIAMAASIGVDQVILRTLSHEDGADLDGWGQAKSRGGGTFVYGQEEMGMDELRQVDVAARRHAAAVGMTIATEWNDFIDHHGPAPGRPLCSEPWKTIYALNRGILPCCFGRAPLASWKERDARSVEQFIGDTFNGPSYQALRRSLAAGVLPDYCLSSHSCPITRNATRDASRARQVAGDRPGDAGPACPE